MLRLLQAQLSVSTYTDAIDRPDLQSNKRVHAQILKICAFLSGVATSVDYEEGQKLLATKQWKTHENWFRRVMELGRRYKVWSACSCSRMFFFGCYFSFCFSLICFSLLGFESGPHEN